MMRTDKNSAICDSEKM